MVWVRETSHTDSAAGYDLSGWHTRFVELYPESDAQLVGSALSCVQSSSHRAGVDCNDWAQDANFVADCLDIGLILIELKVDVQALCAGLLYRAVREQRLSVESVRRQFGPSVEGLVVGVLKMADVADVQHFKSTAVLGQAQSANDNLRQMLVAMVDDVRVALIKLAERTCAIRMVKNDEQRRERLAAEVSGLYVPLAHRLGIGQLKWELEDLAFRYTQGSVYKRIAKLLDGKRVERDRYIRRVSQTVDAALREASVISEINGRAKHIFSIWKKMQRKGIGFSQVHDIRAIRILVPTVKDCYTTLGVIHGLWRTIPNEFDDYIANPKPNGYRSLHTAVIGPEGKVLEVQVRTPEMHDEAELGVCAHWRYKHSDRTASGSVYDEKIEWLRQALHWHDETGGASSISESLRFDADYDRVFVFTPKGDIVNLMQGATPIDFAYHVHTQIGHRCKGARVNGSLVPLNHALNTGDRVHIITSDAPVPKREWLNSESKWVVTSRARAQILQWFKSQRREDNLAAGRALLEKAFKRLAMNALDYKRIARKVQCPTVEDMYVAVGSGELAAQGVLAVAESLMTPNSSATVPLVLPPKSEGTLHSWGGTRGRIHRAGCCTPVQGDRVAGFVTRSRGVSVHRVDCSRWIKLVDIAPDRVVEVLWEQGEIAGLEVVIDIRAYDRKGLLRDVTDTISRSGGNMLSVNTQTDRRTQLAYLHIELEVASLAVLDASLGQLNRLPNVISAQRLSEAAQNA